MMYIARMEMSKGGKEERDLIINLPTPRSDCQSVKLEFFGGGWVGEVGGWGEWGVGETKRRDRQEE